MTPARYRKLRAVLERRQLDLTVLMENVHKHHNYAAVLRTCDAVGIHRAHAIASHRVVGDIKASSASAAQWVHVAVHGNIHEAASHLHQRGFQLVAAHLGPEARDFRAVDYTRPTCVVLGTERAGLTEEALQHVDAQVTIPMAGVVASLNVSVAAAVILYEAQRQRAAAGHYERAQWSAAALEHELFEWCYPEVARHCRQRGAPYPKMDDEGTITGDFPR